MDERSQRAVAQLVGCGPQSGCIACPPTPEELRLSFFRCEEVNPDVDEGVPPGGVLQALLPAPGPGIGLVDSLMPQWDKTGANWTITDEDRRMLAEYEAWLPAKIFDAHAHLWNFEYWSDQVQTKQGWIDGASNPGDPMAAGDMEMFKTQMDRFCPGREMGGLVLSTPNMAADNLGHSAWSAEECRKTMAASPGYGFFVCAMTTTMDTTYDDIVQGVRDFGYVGLKCYHFYSKNVEHTFDSDIMQYVTHEQCRAANELGLSLSIHMVKRRALSDPSNLETIRMLCETYPNMKVILCHSARGFNMHHVIESIGELKGLENLYFDTGAVTEAGATNALIRAFGPQKVMYGSDWPVAEGRGKCISLGDSFIWLTPDNIDLFARYSKDNIVAPALIGFETLRALKQACDECGLTRAEVEDVFWGNAQRLWGDRMRQFVADHPEPCALPAPDLGRAEDYVVHANNNFTALTGQSPSEFAKKAVAAQKL